MRDLYSERRDVLIGGLRAAGWDMPCPAASMFAWAPIPERFADMGSVEFSKLLLARAKVAVAPGIGFGEHGDGHVRIALVENKHRIRQAVRNIRAASCRPDQRARRPSSRARGARSIRRHDPAAFGRRRRPRHGRRAAC